jgi:hypothetical protein
VKYLLLPTAAAALLVIQGGCSSGGSGAGAPQLISARENRKFGLICQFYGHEVTLDGGKREKVVEYVSVKRERDGAQVRYKPADGETLSESSGYFEQVWSPDDETIVLPLGRYDGFWITRSSEAFSKLSNGGSDDSIRVQLNTGARLWHEFSRWKGTGCFQFTAGLSGQQTTFTYSIRGKRLTTSEKINSDFYGENAAGRLKILEESGAGSECDDR